MAVADVTKGVTGEVYGLVIGPSTFKRQVEDEAMGTGF